MTGLQISCVAFYGLWRFFDEYYSYKINKVEGCFKINYVKVLLMTYLIALPSKLFPFFVGFGIALSLIAGFLITLLPVPSEQIELQVKNGLTESWGKVLFDSVLSLILFWVVTAQ